jgi:HEAT repeat protein
MGRLIQKTPVITSLSGTLGFRAPDIRPDAVRHPSREVPLAEALYIQQVMDSLPHESTALQTQGLPRFGNPPTQLRSVTNSEIRRRYEGRYSSVLPSHEAERVINLADFDLNPFHLMLTKLILKGKTLVTLAEIFDALFFTKEDIHSIARTPLSHDLILNLLRHLPAADLDIIIPALGTVFLATDDEKVYTRVLEIIDHIGYDGFDHLLSWCHSLLLNKRPSPVACKKISASIQKAYSTHEVHEGFGPFLLACDHKDPRIVDLSPWSFSGRLLSDSKLKYALQHNADISGATLYRGADLDTLSLTEDALPALEKILLGKGRYYELRMGDKIDISVQIRSQAATVLGKSSSAEAVYILEKYLERDKGEELVRAVALTALGLRAFPRSRLLIEQHVFHEDPMVSQAAVEALGELGDIRSIPTLVAATRYSKKNVNDASKRAAIVAIATIGSALAETALMGIIKRRDQFFQSHRTLAMKKLISSPFFIDIGFLIKVTKNIHNDAIVGQLALDALAGFAYEGSEAAICYLRFVADPNNKLFNESFKLSAMAALIKAKDLKAVPLLESTLLSQGTKRLYEQALEGLERIGTKKSLALLQEIRKRATTDTAGPVLDLPLLDADPLILEDIDTAMHTLAKRLAN